MRILLKKTLLSLAPVLGVASSSSGLTTVPRADSTASARAPAGPLGHALRLGLQQLVCRGGPGLKLEVYKDPSPDDARYLRVVLRYQRQTAVAGSDYLWLEPGKCTWNYSADPKQPVEPGFVYFDIAREAQPWSSKETRQMDTTVDAAVFFKDLISLPRYFADAGKYWSFYVDDKTQLSISFGPFKPTVTQPKYFTVSGSLVREAPTPADVSTLSLTRELRCRGGPDGLAFTRGASAGSNLVKMTVAYRVASVEFGATGKGVGPGMCAWVKRGAGAAEPGHIEFTTAANAQLSQIRSGSAVDRTPTAAERFPDANTIPAYMREPNHFWTFTVSRTEPAVARTNAAWKPSLIDIVAGKPPAQSPRTSAVSSLPAPPGVGAREQPGIASSRAVRAAVGIQDVQVYPGTDSVLFLYSAETGASTGVLISTTPPSGSAGNYTFAGPSTGVPMQGTSRGTLSRFVGRSGPTLLRNTRYWYIIWAVLSDGTRIQRTSEFKTLRQSLTISISEIYLVSDGDAESNGELRFEFTSCPSSVLSGFYLPDIAEALRTEVHTLDWGEGRHRVNREMVSADTLSVPDRIRVVVNGVEDDESVIRQFTPFTQSELAPRAGCRNGGDLGVGRSRDYEWNSITRDIDLTRYPGLLATEQFVWRSKPLRDGSTLMFEVRGYLQVIRK